MAEKIEVTEATGLTIGADISDDVRANAPVRGAWEAGRDGSWSFASIGEDFDSHVRRHLPGYDAVQHLAVSAASWHVREGARVLDIGCSTGQTLGLLAGRSPHEFEAVGIDPDEAMILRTAKRLSNFRGEMKLLADRFPATTPAGQFDVIFALWSLQFMSTRERWEALGAIADLIAHGGLLVLAEKVEAVDAPTEALWSGLLSDWKLQNGVTAEEIIAKWSALRGQLVTWPAEAYTTWAAGAGLSGEIVWCWGPFRCWCFAKGPSVLPDFR